MINDINLKHDIKYHQIYDSCQISKIIRKSFKRSQKVVIESLNCIDFDINDFELSISHEEKKL